MKSNGLYIYLTTNLNGTVFDSNGGTVGVNLATGSVFNVRYWDGEIVGVRTTNSRDKTNNGTTRDFFMFIGNPKAVTVIRLSSAGLTSISDLSSLINCTNVQISTNAGLAVCPALPPGVTVLTITTSSISSLIGLLPSTLTSLTVNSGNLTSAGTPNLSGMSLATINLSANLLTSMPSINMNAWTIFIMNGTSTKNLIPTIDLSSKTANLAITNISVGGNSTFTSFTLPAVSFTVSTRFDCSSSTALTSIGNLSNMTFLAGTLTSNFTVDTCALNITFPIGTTIFANQINLQGNGMSLANVNATVDNLYSGRASFNNTVTHTLTMQGTNAAPSGTKQMPTGFSYGVSDGTPASQKEKIWVMENQTNDGTGSGGALKYKWTITTN